MMRRVLLLLFLWCGLAQAAEPVRYQLVSNLNTPENMLIVGEKNPGATVRCASASSVRTPARTTSSWMTIYMG